MEAEGFEIDGVSGEQVVYTYDALNRLASATATSLSWGQSYTYDGSGNLTGQTVTTGSAPAFQTSYNASTNQSYGMDANGNMPGYVYDVENRIKGPNVAESFEYSYAPGNKRVWRGVWTTNSGITSLTTDEVTFWSVTGQKLATYQIQVGTNTLQMTQTGTNYYFGAKLIKNAGGYVVADRLGSIGKFYPWGQEKPSATTNGTEKFTGYFRDAETGLDYADQRYHNPGTGRFLTPDRYQGILTDPGSWNRYAYTRGDPVNRTDHMGTCDQSADTDNSITVCGTPDPVAPILNVGYGCDDFWCNTESAITNALSGIPILGTVQVQLPSPNLPKINPYTAAQVQAITNGFDFALLAIASNPDCAQLFDPQSASTEDPAETATGFDLGVLYDTLYSIQNLGNPTVAAQTNSQTSVFINSTGAFFGTPSANGSITVNLPNPATGNFGPIDLPSIISTSHN